MDFSKFKHVIETRVRTYHVDSQNIVHNGWYLFLFEEGRFEYYRSLGLIIDRDLFMKRTKIQVVRNTVDYKNPAFFDEVLKIFTRVAYVKNSSVGVEQFIIELGSQRLIAEGTGVLVYLNAVTNTPERVPEEYRKKILDYEKGDVEFI